MKTPDAKYNRDTNRDMISATRKGITAALYICAAIAVLARDDDAHAAPTVVLVVVATVAVLWGYYSDNQRRLNVSLLPAAIALECLIQLTIPQDLTAQLVLTTVLAVLLLLSKQKTNIAKTVHKWWTPWLHWDHILYTGRRHIFAWTGVRVIIVTISNNSIDTRTWFTSQLLLFLAILAYAAATSDLQKAAAEARAAKFDPRKDNELRITWRADSAHGTRLLVTAIFGAVAIMYTGMDVVPWGMSTIFVAVPIYFVLNGSIPSGHHRTSGYSTGELILAIVCIGIALGANHTSPVRDKGVAAYSAVCQRFNGMEVCPANPTSTQIVNHAAGKCCCADNRIPLADKSACVPRHCIQRVQPVGNTEWDCCGNALADKKNKKLRGGEYHCVCGNTPSNPTLHTVSKDGARCVCANNYTGTYCGCAPGYTGMYCTDAT